MNPIPETFEPERHELRETPKYIFPVTRRQFLETTGAGLLFFVAVEAAAQTGGGGQTLEARLHIAENGTITVLTGKVEEGQGPRTEFAMVAAEELRVPLSQIVVQMADTDLVPNDGITAGSRSTPANVPVIRRAAAAARELLQKSGARSYADMAKSTELARAYKESLPQGITLTTATDWKILGKPQHRINGADIVTGQHAFPSDIQRPGMLYGSILRPPSFEATLNSVDLEPAKTIKGAVPVRDGQFAGCAAPTSYAARKAVEAIGATASWNEKPHPSSTGLFDYLKAHPAAGGTRNKPIVKGDVEAALAGAKTKLQARYTAAYVHHAPMEPRAAVAEWVDGKLTVWTGTSNPFSVRDALVKAFQMPATKVRVIVPDFGGGFGGKHTGEPAIEAARLAREAGKPVSLRWTRAEEFMWSYCRPAALIEIEAALDDSNGLLAWDFSNYNSGTAAIDSPYRSTNTRIRYIPSETPLRQGSYRALASTANNFAREGFLDELAAAAKQQPLEFRLANLNNDRIREVLLAATNRFRWQERRKAPRAANRGIGLACGTEKNSVVAACVEVEVDPRTGTPRLLEICQAFECGAILNPAGLSAQVEGCILMGLGATLREELLFENGRLKNGRFSQYRVPRFKDVPKIDLVLVDKKNADPVGAGETPIIAVAPAMANAIFDTTGKRVRSMPLTLG